MLMKVATFSLGTTLVIVNPGRGYFRGKRGLLEAPKKTRRKGGDIIGIIGRKSLQIASFRGGEKRREKRAI